MIPAEFDYVAPESLDEAVRILTENGEEAKLLAGGHSLIPLMKLRLAAPALLVDLHKVPGLDSLQSDGELRIGPMVPHATLESDPELGLLARVASTIADPQVRNRGTIGGSLAHGDPASDLPAVLLAADGVVVARGPNGDREIPASEFFVDFLETALQPEEVITEIRMPSPQPWSSGYQKFNRRREDWAMVAVGAMVKMRDGACEDVRIGLTNMGTTPLRATAAEDALRGREPTEEAVAAAAEYAAEGTRPSGDLNATPDYKRHLARVLCRRALLEAVAV